MCEAEPLIHRGDTPDTPDVMMKSSDRVTLVTDSPPLVTPVDNSTQLTTGKLSHSNDNNVCYAAQPAQPVVSCDRGVSTTATAGNMTAPGMNSGLSVQMEDDIQRGPPPKEEIADATPPVPPAPRVGIVGPPTPGTGEAQEQATLDDMGAAAIVGRGVQARKIQSIKSRVLFDA